MTRALLAALLLLLTSTAAEAAGRTLALLVGVSQYQNLDSSMWLEGPRNDVAMYRDFLVERGIPAADVTVLADGLQGAGDPTRHAIMGALDSIAARADRGDFVFLMFAGHGSQQPAKPDDRDEADGLDEIFLPRDVGKWDGEISALPQAITDNDLGAAIARIRARGAFVWAVFDNCHSGTITRAMPVPGERDRQVKPEQLGIDPQVLLAARARAAARAGAEHTRGGGGPREESPGLDRAGGRPADGVGGFVAFYAAQSQETTPEASLPAYSADAVSRGLFSYTLYQVLSAHPDATYRQAIEQVLQTYQGMGRQQPTPTYEGTALDATVFGARPGSAIVQWRVDRNGQALRLHAGLMHQVTQDSILAVVPTPTSADSEVLGYVRVSSAAATAAEVVPVEYNKRPAFDPATLGASAFARPVDLKVDFTLRVSAPAAGGACEAPAALLTGAIAELRAAKGIASRVRWVAATDPADLRLCQKAGRVLLLDGSAGLDASGLRAAPALALPKTVSTAAKGQSSLSPFALELGQALEKAGRVANLARLAAGVGGASRLDITLTLQPQCAGRPGCDRTPQVLSPSTRPVIHNGDKIIVSVANPSPQPIDLTVLYVDARFGISVMYPNPDELPRIESRARKEFEIDVQADPAKGDPIGFERLLTIAVPVTPQAPPTSFVGLAQEGVAASAKRGGSQGGIVDLFEEAAFGTGGQGTTRGGGRAGQGITGSAEIATFGWTVAPSQP